MRIAPSNDQKNLVFSLQNSEFKWPITTISNFHEFNDQIFISGIDGIIRCFDLRRSGASTPNILYELKGHSDSVTGISISPNGQNLLSVSMDNSLKVWDITGNSNSGASEIMTISDPNMKFHSDFEKPLLRCSWAPNGKWVTSGSADMPSSHVHVWKLSLFEKPKPKYSILYKLPGHLGSINEVVFHPQQPIIASCSNDKTIFIGEIMNYGI